MMKKTVAIVLAAAMCLGLAACSTPTPATDAPAETKPTEQEAPASELAASSGEDLTFVVIPKVMHAWCDEIHKGAQKQADILSAQLGVQVNVDYRAPQAADVVEQNSVLEQAAATNPDGIAIDPVDFEGERAVIEEIQAKGIPVVVFDSVAPADTGITNVGNDYSEQGAVAAELLAEKLGGKGKVAVMQGYPAAQNHTERYEAILATLAKYPDIEVIDGGIDNDSNEESRTQAAAVLAANPDLNGYINCDATTAGLAAAIEEAGRQDQVTFVGMDCLIEILDYVDSGTVSATVATIPQMQGSMSVLMLWQAHCGAELPQFVDTGVARIDASNADYWRELLTSN